MKPRVYRDPHKLVWVVSHDDCGYRGAFHYWELALRLALGHECPVPVEWEPRGIRVVGVRKRRFRAAQNSRLTGANARMKDVPAGCVNTPWELTATPQPTQPGGDGL